MSIPDADWAKQRAFHRPLRGLACADTLVHLVGVAHFVYVSVAQPAPLMRAYVAARTQGEALLRASGLPATVLRPWYVLAPGHRWPLLLPAYWIGERVSPTRKSARCLGLVTREQMVAALVSAVEHPRPTCT